MPTELLLLLSGVPELRGPAPHVFGPQRRYQLLALLACAAGAWVPRERAASLLWPERSSADARRNLRKVVLDARGVPGAGALEASEHALRWQVDSDLQRFDAALAAGQVATALALRRGLPLENMDAAHNEALTDWLRQQRERWDGAWQRAAHAHLATLTDVGARGEWADRLLALDSLDDAAMAERLAVDFAQGHAAQARQRYRAFAERLAKELGIEPSARIRALFDDPVAVVSRDTAHATPQMAVRADTGASSDPEASSRNATEFVGRRTELGELELLLTRSDARQVTVLGPGGVGKSRLAGQAMQRCAPVFPGGAWWVELQDLDELAPVAARIAATRGLHFDDTRDPIPQLAAGCCAGRCLLVLDNAEHLSGLGAWLEQLLHAATSLVVLCTSRVRLDRPAEALLPLAGLAVPDEESRDFDASANFDAVRLFDARARAVQRGFSLARHLSDVLAIVEAVDGMPLAIELAAAWVRLLPPAQIARELADSLDVLARDPARDAAGAEGLARPEHASVREVLERSWQMLSPGERTALAALSIFEGGFVPGAARAVASVPIVLLSSLVDKSLVAVSDAGRFSLHPLVRAYAAEQLGADPSAVATVARRHAEYFAHAVDALARAHPQDRRPLIAGITAEASNLRAAWRHALVLEQPELVSAMVTGLQLYFDQTGRMGEGAALLRTALALPERGHASQLALAQVRNSVANLLYRRRDLDDAQRLAESGIAIAERCGDRRSLFGSLSICGACYSTAGRWREAKPLFERALAVAQEDGVRAETARALTDLGVIAKKEGQFELALERYTGALSINTELGRHDAAARCINNIGVLHMERNDWAHARDVMQEGVVMCERYAIDSLLPYLQNGLGLALFELGDLDAAEGQLERALQRSIATEVLSVEMLSRCLLARADVRRGRVDRARARFREAARTARRLGLVTDLLDIALYYAECLRDSGDAQEAARVWDVVIAHPNAEAGIRTSAAHWRQKLALVPAQQAELERCPASLDEVIDRLLATGQDDPAAAKR